MTPRFCFYFHSRSFLLALALSLSHSLAVCLFCLSLFFSFSVSNFFFPVFVSRVAIPYLYKTRVLNLLVLSAFPFSCIFSFLFLFHFLFLTLSMDSLFKDYDFAMDNAKRSADLEGGCKEYSNDALLQLILGVQDYIAETANAGITVNPPLMDLQWKMYHYMRQQALEMGYDHGMSHVALSIYEFRHYILIFCYLLMFVNRQLSVKPSLHNIPPSTCILRLCRCRCRWRRRSIISLLLLFSLYPYFHLYLSCYLVI